MPRRWTAALLGAVLLAAAACTGGTADRPATPTNSSPRLTPPPLPVFDASERPAGVYLTVQPAWSVEDYQRIKDEVFDEVGPDGLRAFLFDHVRRLAEDIAVAARAAGYPDAEVALRWNPPWCRGGDACPSGGPDPWHVLLAGPFADAPPAFTDPDRSGITTAEHDAMFGYFDSALIREFHTPFAGTGFAVVPAHMEDLEQHRYSPSIQAVWFG